MGAFIVIVILLIIALIVAASCIKIVPQAHAAIVECLGAYRATWRGNSFPQALCGSDCKENQFKRAGS